MAVVRKTKPKTKPKTKTKPKPKPKPKLKPRLRTYYATLLVTRAEEWWVEAESMEDAQALLASGEGQRSAPGERVHVELESMLDAARD